MTLSIARGDWRCEVAPGTGGGIARLSFGDRDVLRPAPHGTANVLDLASFPLVPFANRIGEGHLLFEGERLVLDPDPAALPHAHHGHGWRREWAVLGQAEGWIELGFDHAGDQGWAWPYSVRQVIELIDDGLTITFAVTNHDRMRAMPAGTGLHPYFVRNGEAKILGRSQGVWENAADGLASHFVADSAFRSGEWVEVLSLQGTDNFFASHGPVKVRSNGYEMTLGGDAMAGFHVYVPDGTNFFCVEPVSHAPNAFGRGEYPAGSIVEPDTTVAWNWTISVA